MAATDFNPYCQWLGLTAGRSPTFYELLGLAAFEASPAAIESAARQRMVLVQSHRQAPHVAVADDLLRELLAAQECLLSPQKKTEYDDALRQQLTAARPEQAVTQPARRRRVPMLPPSVSAAPTTVVRPIPPPVSPPSVTPIPLPRPAAPEPNGPPGETIGGRRRDWQTFAMTLALTTGLLVLVLGWSSQFRRPAAVAQSPAVAAAQLPSQQAAPQGETMPDEPPLEFASLPSAGPAAPYRPLELPQASSPAPKVDAATSAASDSTGQESSSYAQLVNANVLAGHKLPVNGVAFTPDGTRIVSASWDGTLRAWDVPTKQLLGELKPGGRERCLVVNSSGALAASGGSDRTVRLWDLASLRERRAYPAADAAIRGLAFTADGDYLAWGTGNGRLSFRRTDETTEQFRFGDGDGGPIAAIQFLADRRHVVFGLGNSIRILRAGTSKTLKLNGHQQLISGLDLSPGARQLASCSWDNTIRLWNLKTGQTVRVLKHTNSVHAIAYSSDGRRLLSASGGHFSGPEKFIEGVDNSVRLWNTADGRELLRLKGHDEPVLCVAFSPDGRWAASGGMDKMVRLWELKPSDFNP